MSYFQIGATIKMLGGLLIKLNNLHFLSSLELCLYTLGCFSVLDSKWAHFVTFEGLFIKISNNGFWQYWKLIHQYLSQRNKKKCGNLEQTDFKLWMLISWKLYFWLWPSYVFINSYLWFRQKPIQSEVNNKDACADLCSLQDADPTHFEAFVCIPVGKMGGA